MQHYYLIFLCFLNKIGTEALKGQNLLLKNMTLLIIHFVQADRETPNWQLLLHILHLNI